MSKKDIAFKELMDHPDERVQAVIAARLGVKSTQEETRTQSFLGIQERGPLPIYLHYYGGHTGRASGGDGVNLQNLPSRDPRKMALRNSLRAPEGHTFVACDSSQIEARVVAYLAGQWDLVEAFREGDDIYSSFASDLYGYPVNRKLVEVGPDGKEHKPFKREGDVGKQAILGLGFGMGEDKFGTTVKVETGIELPPGDAAKAVNLYRSKYGKIKALWDGCGDALAALARGASAEVGTLCVRYAEDRVWLPNGMTMHYANIRAKAGQWPDGRPKIEYVYDRKRGRGSVEKYVYGGKAAENLVQALARIVVFTQMARVHDRYRPILTVHDEVVVCVPDAGVDDAKKFMVEVMSTPPTWAPDLPIACEVSTGKTYGGCK